MQSLGLSRPLLVADPFYASNQAILGKVTEGLKSFDSFFDIIPDPTTESVDRCLRKIKSSSFDSIIALGGGSAMVSSWPRTHETILLTMEIIVCNRIRQRQLVYSLCMVER